MDHVAAVDLARQRAGEDPRFLRAEAHRAAELGAVVALQRLAGAVAPLGDERDDRVLRIALELRRIRAGQAEHAARVLDHGNLHAEADAEVGHAVLAGVAHRRDLALDAALAEAARHEDRVHAGEAAVPAASRSVDST